MTMRIGSNVVKNGLIFAVDAANPKSHATGSTFWKDVIGEVQMETYTAEGARGTTTFPVYSSDNGGCLKFISANASGLQASCSLAFTNDEISMEAWFRIDDDNNVGNNPRIVELWDDLTNFANDCYDGHALNFESDKTIRAWTNEGPATANTNRVYQFDSDPTTYGTLGQWYHWIVTHNGSIGYSYLNGVEIDSTVIAGGVRDTDRINIGNIGNWYSSGHMIYDMSIAVVRIYNVALTYEQVMFNFNAHRARFGV